MTDLKNISLPFSSAKPKCRGFGKLQSVNFNLKLDVSDNSKDLNFSRCQGHLLKSDILPSARYIDSSSSDRKIIKVDVSVQVNVGIELRQLQSVRIAEAIVQLQMNIMISLKS